MTQRNPMNDRYTNEVRGKTRKSSASAKPKATRAATLRDPVKKTSKQKKAERRQRERQQAEKADALQMRFEDTPGYKKLRRTWWVFLGLAVFVTVVAVYINQQSSFFEENPAGLLLGFLNQATANTISTVFMVAAYVFIIIAFYIDLGKIRRERKIFNASLLNDNSKEARKKQKSAMAKQRAESQEKAQKEASEKEKHNLSAQQKSDNAQSSVQADGVAKSGPLAWFSRGKSEAKDAKTQLQQKAEKTKSELNK